MTNMETDIDLDLHNVDTALYLLHHYTKQIDSHGLDLHHHYRLHLTSVRQLLRLNHQDTPTRIRSRIDLHQHYRYHHISVRQLLRFKHQLAETITIKLSISTFNPTNSWNFNYFRTTTTTGLYCEGFSFTL